tara:strand:- start:423 stop:815 length:393 start_codon:yes stop_codon:yes gene_type:complete
MATVNATLTMTSSDLTTDAISLSVLNTISSATQGGVSRLKLATTAVSGATIVAPAAKFTEGAKVWLYNPSTTTDGTERIYVSFDETTAQVVLKGGDWALVPWSASTRTTDKNIEAWGQTADAILEFGVFQ